MTHYLTLARGIISVVSMAAGGKMKKEFHSRIILKDIVSAILVIDL